MTRPRRVRQLSSNSVNSMGSLSWNSDNGQGFFLPRDGNSSMNSIDSSFTASTATGNTPSNSPPGNPRSINRRLRNIKRKLLLEQVHAASLEEAAASTSSAAKGTKNVASDMDPNASSESPRDDALMDELLKSWFQQNVFHQDE